MEKIPYYLKLGEKESILSNIDGEIIFYIPESYFEKEFAVMRGEVITLMGFFKYSVNEKGGKPKLYTFDFASVFDTIPTSIETLKNIKLTKDTPVMDYRILKYEKGAKLVLSSAVPQAVANMEEFLRMMNSGSMPNIYKYNDLHEVYIDSAVLNGESYQVSASLIGVVISEICRAKDDRSKPYRLSGSTNPYEYQMVNIKELPNLVSPFTALTSENWNESVANAIQNKKPGYSPLEKLIIQ